MKTIHASFFFHPHFIVKYYLYRDIRTVAKQYSFTGNIIDIGCGQKPYKSLFKQISTYIGIDFKNYSLNKTFASEKPDFFFDRNYLNTSHLPFANKQFDHAVAFQVLEHHSNPQLLIQEMTRVIKKSGYILMSVPFIGGLHEKPHDYYRLTKYSLLHELKKNKCKVIEVKQQGSISSVLAMLCLDYLIEIAQRHPLLRLLAVVLSPLFLLFSYSCLLIDKLLPSENVCLNYLVVAKKL